MVGVGVKRETGVRRRRRRALLHTGNRVDVVAHWNDVVANAVEDALKPLAIKVDEISLTPQRLLRLIEGARTGEK